MSKQVFIANGRGEETRDDVRVKLELTSEGLKGFYYNREDSFEPMNPFAFGSYFDFRGIKDESLFELQAFLQQTGFHRDPYGQQFPIEQQVSIMADYLSDELNAELPRRDRLIFCELFEQLYPAFWPYMARENSCILYDGFYGRFIAQQYLPFHSASSYEALVESVFGVARKDTLREASKIDASGFALAYVYKGVLPVEQILGAVVDPKVNLLDFPVNPEPYKVLLNLSSTIRLRLLEDMATNTKLETWLFDDVLELLSTFPPQLMKRLKGSATWEDLHERLMKYSDAVEGANVISVPQKLASIAGELEGFVFTPLQRAKEFAVLGEYLEICIGKAGYYKKATLGTSYCFAGFKDGSPKIAMEIAQNEDKWKVLQLRGHKNAAIEGASKFIDLIEERLNGDTNG